ncbi:hypothetical protein HYE67_006779 [Fusarium culmorum]|uniref:Uncharacterized protein n=1 Tax=Fusarium culmorum TaxID=5516 RepID=A0A2T4H0P4_FUSCU|nr:hypothetical protein FCULG_00007806 [Fusarium culmorum]QPC64548.1 hypothetical protein HYE67_006779 [Fusarium culmorum]
MSVYSIYPLSLVGAIPDLDWECPQTPPPPAPPEAPPLPIFEQTPVKTFIDLEEEAEFKAGLLEEMARESRFGAYTAQLPHSEVDWSVSTEAIDAGVCPIPEAGCKGIKGASGHIGRRLKAHLGQIVHKPKFVMFRTMNIEFLDPSGLVSSPESVAMEWEPTTPVDTGRVVPDSQEDPFAFCFAVPDSTADSEEDLDRTG